jgi:hypothetical protein
MINFVNAYMIQILQQIIRKSIKYLVFIDNVLAIIAHNYTTTILNIVVSHYFLMKTMKLMHSKGNSKFKLHLILFN